MSVVKFILHNKLGYFFSTAEVSEDFDIQCVSKSVPGQMEFLCPFQNQLTSVLCSFDGGEQENCSFPLVLDGDRFGIDHHMVLVTVTDELSVSQELNFTFQLTNSKWHG